MNTGLVISMLAGIAAGLAAAGMALVLEWGWLIAIALYCVCGTLTLVVCAVVGVVLSVRASCRAELPARSVPGTGMIFASP